jgi:holo-[acyl-carrier protein] synthase
MIYYSISCLNIWVQKEDLVLILGIGVDIVEIKRINVIMEKNKSFLHKIFNKEEIVYFEKRMLRPEHVAGGFAAKEAVAKALGTGFRGFGFKDIIITRNALGKPEVKLLGMAREIALKKGEYIFHLSISHGQDSAIAYAVLEGHLGGSSSEEKPRKEN